ncbi:ABC transporter permease [Fulvivirga sp. 29W222]|uniref:ABC transporter permease n=1 Tax=Fulvivirga marina TaxID=2494733 RepID=A0A937FU01_9BACT|nr:ABC transporter permease [Fulvivirga marina]MBL6444898.1 ABC transporter permease [Fulvivirga marina]
MLRNHFVIAFRNIWREKTFSFLNIAGLSVGICCALILILYVNNEFSYDKHHENAENLYRLNTVFPGSGGDGMPTGSPPIAWALKEELPEIDNVVRVVNPPQVEKNLFRYRDKMFYETRGFLVDSTFFDVFNYQFIEGEPQTALDRPGTVVIKESIAKKIFPEASSLGQLITIINGDDPHEYEVTGVIADKQGNSHIDANFFITMNSPGWGELINSITTWAGQNFVYSYMSIKDGTDPAQLERKINDVLQKRGAEHFQTQGRTKELRMMPVKDIHLYSGNDLDLSINGSIERVSIISLIGFFILVIACVNFVNLATAKAGKRALEIGIRKTLGAQRGSLIIQFFMEVVLFILFAALLGFLLLDIFLPFFNYLMGQKLDLMSLFTPDILMTIVTVLLVTAIISGSYPALLLSSYQPAKVLKQKVAVSSGAQWFRKGLVVFQFVVSIVLIGAVTIMVQQMDYMSNYDMGFSSGSKIVVPLNTPTAKATYQNMQQELGNIAGVQYVTATSYLPGDQVFNDLRVYTEGQTIHDGVLTGINRVDYDYLETLKIQIIAGRGFIREIAGNERDVILNRKAVEDYGYTPEEIIGREVYTDSFSGEQFSFTVIGVVEDFNQRSLHYGIEPLMLQHRQEESYEYMLVTVSPESFKPVLAHMQNRWGEIVQDTPWEYSELDQSLRSKYEADQKAITLIFSASIIAIIIACLGLFGLSLFAAQKRQKEISIRKVFGASVKQLMRMQYKSFFTMILIALLIAIPLIYYGMGQWLAGFVYKVEIGVGVFVLSGVVAFAIAILTVSYQSVKVALANPVDILRNE